VRSYQIIDFGSPLRETELTDPTPTGHEVVVAVKAAGVCHSDLHIWEGSYDLGGGRRLMLKDRGVALPLTPGHETAGEIIAVGPKVSDRKIGESVLIYPWIGCGQCRVCREGRENLCMKPRCLGIHCDGGYADQIVVPHSKYALPLDGLDPTTAAPFACSGLTSYSALKKFGPMISDEPLLVIGAGGLGLMCVTILKALGGKGAVVVDIDETRRKAALTAGALSAIDGGAPDALSRVQAALGGPCWAAIDLVGSSLTAALAFDALAKGGKLVTIGLFGGAAPWSLPLIAMKAVTIEGNYTGNLSELGELIELLRSGTILPIPLEARPLAQATQMLEDLKAGRIVGRVVLTP
jgi:D-arabinose 1-dehydrogenase-like Zn-dependent alcohol dehydrogenase